MKLEMLDAKGASKQLKRMIAAHDNIFIAVAWGYNGEAADELIAHASKFASVTFGVNFCQTDAALINRLVGIKNAFIAEVNGATFHPKVYYFETGNSAEAILGSSNFTNGGLSKNFEACIHVSGLASESFFKQIRACLASYRSLQREITPAVAAAYQLQFDAAKRRFRRPPNPIFPSSSAVWLSSDLVNMTWNDYVKQVTASSFHHFDQRLDMLRECRRMFGSVKSSGDLTVAEWTAIAGVIGPREAERGNLDGFDWGWFGSMKGMGDFNQRVRQRDSWLAEAIDSIAPHGDVTYEDFTAFCRSFVKAFKNSERVGGVPTATRLLAMKRPDVFICVSNPNTERLAEALSSSKSALKSTFDSYWANVIEPLRQSPWYNAPRPSGKYAELWDCRVAMLDSIYFQP